MLDTTGDWKNVNNDMLHNLKSLPNIKQDESNGACSTHLEGLEMDTIFKSEKIKGCWQLLQ